MSYFENKGVTDEWYTPKYVFDALNVKFDMDVACPLDTTFISTPTDRIICKDSLITDWQDFCWCNPPFGGRNGILPWINKMIEHNNGIILTPDRTSAEWWQLAAASSDAHLFVCGKIKFIDQFGVEGKSPSTGTTLFAFGNKAVDALVNARNNQLGIVFTSLNK